MKVEDRCLLELCRSRGLLDTSRLKRAEELSVRADGPLFQQLVRAQLLAPEEAAKAVRDLPSVRLHCRACQHPFAFADVSSWESLLCPRCGAEITLESPAESARPKSRASSARRTPRAIGKYVVEKELGRGAFGVVYLARSPELDRPVAVKVLLDPGLADPEDRARFLLEAKVTAKLRDPGIVRVHDIGQEGGRPFFVMDYSPGLTLQERLKQGPLPIGKAIRIVSELARSMSVAHEAGVLHRDLKPGNVILDEESGRPCITDFGLARDRSLLQSMTKTGDVLGTPMYMAPEQIRGDRKLDHLVDIYSLGAVLFRCLTGEHPLRGRNFVELAQLVQHVMPCPPSELRPEIPATLDAICLRALAKDPSERFQSGLELQEALQAVRGGRRRRSNVWPANLAPILAAAGLLGLAGLVLAFALRRSSSPTPAARAEVRPTSSAAPEATSPAPPPPVAIRPANAEERPPAVRVRLALLDAAEQRRSLMRYPVILGTLEEARAIAAETGDAELLASVQLDLARLHLARGRYPEALEEAEALQETPEADLIAGFALFGMHEDERSLERLQALANRDEGKFGRVGGALAEILTMWGAEGWSRAQRIERYNAAVTHLNAALVEDENFQPALVVVGAMLLPDLRHGDERGFELLNEAQTLVPDDSQVALFMGESLWRLKQRYERKGRDTRELELYHRDAVEVYLELTEGSGSSMRVVLRGRLDNW